MSVCNSRRGLRTTAVSTLLAVATSIVASSMLVTAAHAGRSCETKRLTTQTVANGLALAERTQHALNASGANVVLIARAGQDLRKYGLRYSHLGFALKDAEGRWRVIHKLNECGTATSNIYRQGLAEFFLDDLFQNEGAYAVPTPEAQTALYRFLSTQDVKALHQASYSVVAYPWSTRYQQSNQWVTETIALAMNPQLAGRERAQAWLKFRDYTPTALKLPALARLGGRMSAANVAFDDHPNEKRFADRIETTTADSVFTWLAKSNLAHPAITLR